MPAHRLKVFTALLAVSGALAAPAAADERTEAQQYAAALQQDLAWDPAVLDAVVADQRARSQTVATGCPRALRAAGKRPARVFTVAVSYALYSTTALTGEYVRWSRDVDARLAAVPTTTPALVAARDARSRLTAIYERMHQTFDVDFCADLTAWWKRGFKGKFAGAKRFNRIVREMTAVAKDAAKPLRGGTRLLKAHGASAAQRDAMRGDRPAPKLPELDDDPVIELLDGKERKRDKPGDGPTRNG